MSFDVERLKSHRAFVRDWLSQMAGLVAWLRAIGVAPRRTRTSPQSCKLEPGSIGMDIGDLETPLAHVSVDELERSEAQLANAKANLERLKMSWQMDTTGGTTKCALARTAEANEEKLFGTCDDAPPLAAVADVCRNSVGQNRSMHSITHSYLNLETLLHSASLCSDLESLNSISSKCVHTRLAHNIAHDERKESRPAEIETKIRQPEVGVVVVGIPERTQAQSDNSNEERFVRRCADARAASPFSHAAMTLPSNVSYLTEASAIHIQPNRKEEQKLRQASSYKDFRRDASPKFLRPSLTVAHLQTKGNQHPLGSCSPLSQSRSPLFGYRTFHLGLQPVQFGTSAVRSM